LEEAFHEQAWVEWKLWNHDGTQLIPNGAEMIRLKSDNVGQVCRLQDTGALQGPSWKRQCTVAHHRYLPLLTIVIRLKQK